LVISEVCKQFGISPYTLRYYEKIGLLPPVPRTSGKVRDYSERDCRFIGFVICMRSAGFQIGPLKEYLKLLDGGPATVSARKELLVSQRDRIVARLAEMSAVLDKLNGKIANYDQQLLATEKSLVAGTGQDFDAPAPLTLDLKG
jgi:DNA-binding transcriptional MerR regulator